MAQYRKNNDMEYPKNYRLIIENQIEKARRWCNDLVRNEAMCVGMNENWFPKVDVYNSMGYKIIHNNVPYTNNKVNRGQDTIYISPIVYPIFMKSEIKKFQIKKKIVNITSYLHQCMVVKWGSTTDVLCYQKIPN